MVNSTTQANNKVRKRGFGSAESRGPQSLPGSIGPTMSSALGTSGGFVTICSPSLMGESTSESPQGRAVQETAFPLPSSRGKEQPPTSLCFPAWTRACHHWVHPAGKRDTTMCQQLGCPQGQAVPGLYDPYWCPFLKDIWCHQVAGTQVSSMASHQAGGPQLDSRMVQGRFLAPPTQGRRHFLLCRQDNALVPPGPFQSSSIPSVGLQASAWATPIHCTQ